MSKKVKILILAPLTIVTMSGCVSAPYPGDKIAMAKITGLKKTSIFLQQTIDEIQDCLKNTKAINPDESLDISGEFYSEKGYVVLKQISSAKPDLSKSAKDCVNAPLSNNKKNIANGLLLQPTLRDLKLNFVFTASVFPRKAGKIRETSLPDVETF